jgi:aspartate/methionine/tyrosine aminotransferase
MRRNIIHAGSNELTYEIREIVKVARTFQNLGVPICWENIGDPVQKGVELPQWMKQIVSDLALDSKSYAYSDSKGILETREFLAKRTNALGGCSITAEDILFCNGLGDAISKVYEYLDRGARVIGPSPAYSTHSSAEGSHARQAPLTYKLDPNNHWLPDLEDLRNQVQYNPSIVGILIINPDNPTGMVYPKDVLEGMIQIAKEFDLFVIADEIYSNVTYNGVRATPLCEVIGDTCGISMKGISKELPWPGSRCGWMEFYNSEQDKDFLKLVQTLENAKMLEVCSTTLPQMAIPAILSHPEFPAYRAQLNTDIQERGDIVLNTLQDLPQVMVHKTYGAFYNTIVFREGVLKENQTLELKDSKVRQFTEESVQGAALDKRFVYYLLAAKGICVVPISSFCSELLGFRVTLLEADVKKMQWVYQNLRDAIIEYTGS